LNFHYYLNVN